MTEMGWLTDLRLLYSEYWKADSVTPITSGMKNRSILTSGITLTMLLGGPSAAAEEHPPGKDVLHVLPLRLAKPQWQPLTAQEIKSQISDHVVVIETEYEPAVDVKVTASFMGGCPPTETFFADGRWAMGVCDRAQRTYKGRWFTETFSGGERLCTEASDQPKECRFVWRGAAVDQIVMSQHSLVGGNRLVDDFNPYRVTPRKGSVSP